MSRKNEIIAKDVAEKKALWADVRRADPILKIRKVMRAKNVLNKDLAERLGVTEANISRILRGRQNLQLDTLYQLADALEEEISIVIGSVEASDNSDCEPPIAEVKDTFVFELERNVYPMEKYRKVQQSTAVTYRSAAFSECAV